MRIRVLVGTFAVGLGLSLMSACGGSSAAPNPVPTPTPTPAPAATPTPSPNPGSVGAYLCKLPASHNPTDGISPCPVLPPQLGGFVNAAIDRAEAQHPELFNFEELSGPSPRVLDKDRYHQVVAEYLAQAGVCTVIEKEELAVKTSNDFNEQWNIYTSGGFVRRRYVTTCLPSWF